MWEALDLKIKDNYFSEKAGPGEITFLDRYFFEAPSCYYANNKALTKLQIHCRTKDLYTDQWHLIHLHVSASLIVPFAA